MKNLYKIENELYIIGNNEDINENDYIITQDGRLVEVSYLLSKDVESGHKVILTTNKLLIKNGIQAIDDEFLEWFVKNSSCEFVEVNEKLIIIQDKPLVQHQGNKPIVVPHRINYKTIIPQEEPKQEELKFKNRQMGAAGFVANKIMENMISKFKKK